MDYKGKNHEIQRGLNTYKSYLRINKKFVDRNREIHGDYGESNAKKSKIFFRQ